MTSLEQSPLYTFLRYTKEDNRVRRDLKDPQFTSVQLATIAKQKHSWVLERLLAAGIGRTTAYRRPTDGVYIRCKVVKFSELLALAKEFNWLNLQEN